MKNTLLLLTAIIVTIYFYQGCTDDIIKNDGNTSIDTNILMTDGWGNILGGDTNDWCIDTTGGFSFGPAYPNPSMGPAVWVKYAVPAADTITLTIRNSLGGEDSVLFHGPVQAGYYTRLIEGASYINTHRKVCISAVSNPSFEGCSSCGDIMFEQ